MLPSISQRPHVIRWLFPFDIAKVQHFRGALSVSVRFSPQRASFGWICPLESIKCYKSMPNCSATYFTATGGSSLSRGLTPSMASSSLWRDSHLWRVFIDTPAASASWAFVIDFMMSDYWLLMTDYWLLMILKRRYLRWPSQVSALAIAGICDKDRSREGWQGDTYIYKKVVREEINVLYSKRISRFRDFLYNIVSPCHPGASECPLAEEVAPEHFHHPLPRHALRLCGGERFEISNVLHNL